MGCQTFQLPGGVTAIACSRGRRARPKCDVCKAPGHYQCDHPATSGTGTCDRDLCERHIVEVKVGVHHCSDGNHR